jgi:hypothetical protein
MGDDRVGWSGSECNVDEQPGRTLVATEIARLMNERANPLVAWRDQSLLSCEPADTTADFRDRKMLPSLSLDLVEQRLVDTRREVHT